MEAVPEVALFKISNVQDGGGRRWGLMHASHTHAGGVYGALHLDVQKRRREEDMKGVRRRGGIYPHCFDTSSVWKAGRDYIAAAQTRGGTHMRPAAQQRAQWTQDGTRRAYT